MRIRTGYSFKTAVGHLEEVMDRLSEIGARCAPISDRCSTFGFTKWTKLCKTRGQRPIYGVELAVVPERGNKRRPVVDYWTFFAKEDIRSLHDLISLATDISDKEPSLTYRHALDAQGVIKITGNRTLLDKIEPQTDLFISLSPSTPLMLYKQAIERKLPFIACSDNYYPNKDDLEFYRVALGRNSNTQTYPQHILSDDEWCEATWFADECTQRLAILDRNIVLEECQATMVPGELLIPDKPKTLKEMCVEGARKVGVNLNDPVYAERLERELRIIDEKRFGDYFYILADMVSWARERMVVGPARGSSCGSLVCYLLGITTIDPIRFGLVFERFIDITRADLPDIDVDFSDAKRQLVFDYAANKYGANHVARLGSVGSFQPLSAFRQVAKSLKIPNWKFEKAATSLIKRGEGDPLAGQTIKDTLETTQAGQDLLKEHPEVAMVSRFEDHPTNAGQHAAGLIITKRPVTDHVAIDRRTGGIMADKKDAEALGLLKIDALGLTQLSIFERTLELIDQKDRWDFFSRIRTDDPEAFAVLNRKQFAGIFQFAGKAVRGLTEQVTVDRLDDLIAITALARPGPLSSDGPKLWAARRMGREPVRYVHEAFEPFLRDTYGVVVYQEQVMAIARQIGDLSWEEVTALRRAIGRSLGKQAFDAAGGTKWKQRAIEKGIPQDTVEKFWDELCAFGQYAFNKAHSVAYGLVSYWSCYLKAHYPLSFAAATLDAEGEPARQIEILKELRDEGVTYTPVDPEKSGKRWEVDIQNRRLIGPLTAIKGIGPRAVEDIIESRRPDGKPLAKHVQKMLDNAKTDIDTLFPIQQAVARFDTSKITTPKSDIKDVTPNTAGQVMIIGVVNAIKLVNENEPARLAKRNGQKRFPETSLNLFVRDDTDEIFCKVSSRDYERLGRPIVDHGKAGKALYAIKGFTPNNGGDFRMIWVSDVRHIGDIDSSSPAPVTTSGMQVQRSG